MNKKRGQITVFIVVGIVILFAVGFVLYASTIQPQLQLFKAKETALQQYIGECLASTAENAITTVGITGGYLDIPEEIAINERSYFSFTPRSNPKIPLWYYRGEPRVPTKQFISEQISKYILEHVDVCFNDFEPFKEQFALQLKGNVTVETTINDNDVLVKLNYPLETTDKASGAISKLDYVTRNVGVKLGRMHDMAVDILKSENQQLFFENLTMELLSSSPDVPFTNMNFDCAPQTWKKSNIIDIAKTAVYYNIQRITVEGNKYTFFDTKDPYQKNHYVFSLDSKYRDIPAVFFYPNTARFELHVRPNDRELLKSNVGRVQNVLLRFLCINTYHFTYDIEYPVLTTLRDDSAFNKKGFIFNFAFPVTINHNAGDKKDFPTTIFESPDLNYDFCQDVSNSLVDIRVKDAFTFEELYKAEVDYKCVRYLCDLGTTNADYGVYSLRTKLPAACTSGLLSARQNGYLEGSTVYDGSGSAEILLTPIQKYKLKFLVHDSDDLNRVTDLKDGETATLVLTSTSEPGFEQVFTSEDPNNELELVHGDGTYHIEILLMEDNKRLIGGYDGDWSMSYSDLMGKSQIVFPVVRKMPIPVTEQEQVDATSYIYDDKTYQQRLKPTFS